MSEDTQVSNVPENGAPESEDATEFFAALDRDINAEILDEKEDFVSETSQPTSEVSPEEVQQGDVETLEKRYADSSREGKRLNQRLGELEPYLPILDAMKEDPNLIRHVRGYFEGGGQAPESVKDQLKLSEDFVFDPDDAMTNSKSDSAKLFNATVDGLVQRRLNTTLASQRQENERLTAEQSFRDKVGLDEDQWKEYLDYAKGHTLTLEDIYFLKNRKNREKNIAENVGKDIQSQMKKSQSKPSSLATSGSTEVESSQDDQLFDAILGIDQQLDNAFG